MTTKTGTIRLNEWSNGEPRRDLKGNLNRAYSPKVRLLTPYVLIADRAAQSKSGTTHLATAFEVNGVLRLDPMTECGMNASSRPSPMTWVKGPVRVTCRRCTTIALLTLGREGRLPGCDQ